MKRLAPLTGGLLSLSLGVSIHAVQNYDYHDAILNTWKGLKARTMDPYWLKMVHRPRSETPDDVVSEGVGYGMLWALYVNDQKTFNEQVLAD